MKFVAISRSPLPEIDAFKRRMGWRSNWVSSCGSDFNYFHTCSTYARGDEQMIGAYHYLDLTPKGRNETGPSFVLTEWVRHHDKYADLPPVSCCASEKECA